ncbi:hypothetical protein ACFL2T_05635 [Elusimicrobiota bacterium]
MNLLNLYFTPFATVLVLIAIYFPAVTAPERIERNIAFGILIASLAINYWFSRNIYRYVGWTNRLRTMQIWITFIWSVALFYLIVPAFAPAYLLVTIPVAAVALNQGRWQTLLAGCVGMAAIIGVYCLRWQGEWVGPQMWAQAWVHAGFMPVLGLFIHSLAQTALRMRDISTR